MRSEWINNGHTMTWVVEDGEIVDRYTDHPRKCMEKVEDTSPRGWHMAASDEKCALAHVENYEPLNEDMMEFDGDFPWTPKDGCFEIDIEYRYHYFKPAYPDWEGDEEFAWRPTSEVRLVGSDIND